MEEVEQELNDLVLMDPSKMLEKWGFDQVKDEKSFAFTWSIVEKKKFKLKRARQVGQLVINVGHA